MSMTSESLAWDGLDQELGVTDTAAPRAPAGDLPWSIRTFLYIGSLGGGLFSSVDRKDTDQFVSMKIMTASCARTDRVTSLA